MNSRYCERMGEIRYIFPIMQYMGGSLLDLDNLWIMVIGLIPGIILYLLFQFVFLYDHAFLWAGLIGLPLYLLIYFSLKRKYP